MRWHAIIGRGELTFGSDLTAARFYEQEGKPVIIELDDRPSAEMRRFFEGAVVPYVFYQSGAAWSDFRECREALKLEFLPSWARDLHGDRVKVARSTADLSKAAFRRFLEEVLRWMETNSMDLPDADEYRRWRESAPAKGEIYPPLQRLKDAHARDN